MSNGNLHPLFNMHLVAFNLKANSIQIQRVRMWKSKPYFNQTLRWIGRSQFPSIGEQHALSATRNRKHCYAYSNSCLVGQVCPKSKMAADRTWDDWSQCVLTSQNRNWRESQIDTQQDQFLHSVPVDREELGRVEAYCVGVK